MPIPSLAVFLAQTTETAAETTEGGEDTSTSLGELFQDPAALAERVGEWAVSLAPRVLFAVLTLVVGLWVVKLVSRGMSNVMVKGKLDESLVRFLSSLLRMGLMKLVVIVALGNLGVQTASFVAILGAAGLAVGLALQGSLANFAAGVLILIFRPFKVGDYIEAGGQAGTVEAVAVFMTQLRTPDNKTIIMPNASVTGGSIVNYSAKDTRRIDLVFGIGYGDDIAKAKRVIEEVIRAEPRVLADPAPQIALSELGDSSVNVVARPWVASGDYWPTRFDLIEKVKLAFDANDITIPFPQRDVHLHQVA
jgi:small conductance mechanosensitive channel